MNIPAYAGSDIFWKGPQDLPAGQSGDLVWVAGNQGIVPVTVLGTCCQATERGQVFNCSHRYLYNMLYYYLNPH